MDDGDYIAEGNKLVRRNAAYMDNNGTPLPQGVHHPPAKKKKISFGQEEDGHLPMSQTLTSTTTKAVEVGDVETTPIKKKVKKEKRPADDDEGDSSDATERKASKVPKKDSKNEEEEYVMTMAPPNMAKYQQNADVPEEEKSTVEQGYDGKMVVKYPSDDLRNPAAVEALFRQSLSDIQAADLPKVYAPDHPAYKDSIQLKLDSVKVTVRIMQNTSDGERKWKNVGYGNVRFVDGGMFDMLQPKLSTRDYFIAKDCQDHPSYTLPDGTQTMDLRLPGNLFRFKAKGPVMPKGSASARAKKK